MTHNTPQPDSHAIAEKFRDDLENDPMRWKASGRNTAMLIVALHAEKLGLTDSDINALWIDRLDA